MLIARNETIKTKMLSTTTRVVDPMRDGIGGPGQVLVDSWRIRILGESSWCGSLTKVSSPTVAV
jgi:hypothetical protein